MTRVCIVCEGQTEVEFIKTCLAPHLAGFKIWAYPALLQAPSGNHRGGCVTVERLVKFISHQYKEADRITTLVDFYGFKQRNGRSRTELEADILKGVQQSTQGFDPRFILPYVQMHEFEALLFSNVEEFQWVLDGWNEKVFSQLQKVRSEFGSPEEINDSPETAPSKRILTIFEKGTYSKTEHGPLIAEATGLDVMREHCPAFNEWVSKLEE